MFDFADTKVKAAQNYKAVLYARVSAPSQVKRGQGIDSQLTRCREFAKHKNYPIAEEFKDEGISGSLVDRPGMLAMLDWLKRNHNSGPFVVIIDDISRLARSIRGHLDLRDAITATGAWLESPAVEFGHDADSRMIENILATISEHHRAKNAEQTKSRMYARVMNGFYVFAPVWGYTYGKHSSGAKILMPDENAPIIQEALESYACGRFQTAAEVARWLTQFPSIPKNKDGIVRRQEAYRMLHRPLYCGRITVEKWKLYLHPGKHEPLISFETWLKIQERLEGRANAPAKANISEDFVLRGAVVCNSCCHPMTAGNSRSRTGKLYPYYFCQRRGCDDYRKSIRAEKLESEFETFLKKLQPSAALLKMARAMLADLWQSQTDVHRKLARDYRTEVAQTERKIDQLVERIMETDSPALISAYEGKLKSLETEKAALQEEAQKKAKPRKTFEEVYRTACSFLSSPWNLWKNGDFEERRMLLRLVFPGKIHYARNEGYRTTGIAAPFRLLENLCAPKCGVVEPDGPTSNQLFQTLQDWEDQILKNREMARRFKL